MPKSKRPDHFVVDGSNIATEGRNEPSLEQLNEAVLAFMGEHPDAVVTVVVDATFGHRIDKKEVKAFDEAVANNELVTPPAGAVGRGDAFVLTIADKARAGVLSNDSFQEFHGEYDWLFDDGRLIGGKPVPHVGWVFVQRTPVRGPKSRRAVRNAKDDAAATDAKERANRRVRAKSSASTPSADATEPDATGSGSEASGSNVTRPRRGRGRGRGAGSPAAASQDAQQQRVIEAAKAAPPPKGQVNDLMPFLEFVEHHPVGTSCTGVVESYASHGAYARVDDVLLYIPLRLMDDPVPRSARSVLSVGEAVALVIVGYVPERRSIDAALPHMAAAPSAAAEEPGSAASGAEEREPTKKAPAKKAPARKAAAKKAPAKRGAAKKAPAKRGAAKKAPAGRTAAATAPTPETPGEQPPAQPVPAKKAAAKKAPAKKAPAKKAPAKKAPVKKAAAKKAPAKKAAAKKAPAKKAAAKKAAAKKAAANETAARRTATNDAPAGTAAARTSSDRRRGGT